MKIAPLVMVALGGFVLVGCGGNEGSDDPAAGMDQVSPAADRAEEGAAPVESGMSADVQAFIQDYEELIDRYCEFADRFSTATMAEMAQLGQEMADQAMKLSEYSARAVALRASLSDEAQARMEELGKKGEACGERIGGGT
jgi:hypothetical protein